MIIGKEFYARNLLLHLQRASFILPIYQQCHFHMMHWQFGTVSLVIYKSYAPIKVGGYKSLVTVYLSSGSQQSCSSLTQQNAI